jgi:hypothetical protein
VAISYESAVSRSLNIVPTGAALAKLAADYARMIEDGLLHDDAESFEDLLRLCGEIQERANRAL